MIGKLLKKVKRSLFVSEPVDFIQRLKDEIVSFNTVFDIGTYHGKFIDEIIKIKATMNVHGFEPFNESFQFLNNKYQGQKNIIINNVAVSDLPGSASFNINAFAETNSLLESVAVNDVINSLTKTESLQEVEVISISSYCEDHTIKSIDLVKIDTQGNSYNVLLGMESLLKEKRIKYLYVEAEFIEIYKNEKLFSEIELLMRSYGYTIVDLYNLNYLNNERLAWCDVLFTIKS